MTGIVRLSKKAYLTIVASSARFANIRIDVQNWLEVSGVLIGKNQNNDVIVSAAYPIMHQKLDKNAVIDQYKWSDEDYLSLSIIDDEAFSRGEFTVGWWHSHPGFKIMMSHIDIRTTLSYQQNNPLAISLVFNPQRLHKQVEMPSKRGDPVLKLENDPGFKIFRLDDVDRGIQANYSEADYTIEEFDNIEKSIQETQKFLLDVTNLLPKENIFKKYENFIQDRVNQLNSLLHGTGEYLKTLVRQGEKSRIPEVLENQKVEINKFVAETFIKVGNIKQFMDYLEYKEREIVIPQVNEILSKWDAAASKIDQKLSELSKIS